MFSQVNTTHASSRAVQASVKKDIDLYFKLDAGPIAAQLQEVRIQLIIALGKYKAIDVEDGDNSQYLYSSHISGRQTKLLDIIGSWQIRGNELSILDLLQDDEGSNTNTKSLTNILLRLSDILQPMKEFPPLKKSSQIHIKNAIILLFETMRKGKFFPAESLPVSIQIIVALAKSINKEKLQHLLCQDPTLIREIHDNAKHKKLLKLADGLLEVVESLYQKIGPSQSPQSNLFGAVFNYTFKLFQEKATSSPITTSQPTIAISDLVSPVENEAEVTPKNR